MGGSDSIYALQEALNDQDKAVRNLAAEALEELNEAQEDTSE
jgi:HEAT repeat protein